MYEFAFKITRKNQHGAICALFKTVCKVSKTWPQEIHNFQFLTSFLTSAYAYKHNSVLCKKKGEKMHHSDFISEDSKEKSILFSSFY